MASDASQSAHSNQKTAIPPLRSKSRNGTQREYPHQKIEQFMFTYPTAEQTALFFDVGVQTLYRYIKRNYGLTFEEFRDKNRSYTKNILTQKAISLAIEKNNVAALIFCLKNICGWSDNIQVTDTRPNTITLRYSLDEPPSPPRDVTPPSQESA